MALRLQNRSKEVNAILTKAQDAGILEEVLTTANITVKSLHDDKTPYTLTPLGYALTFSNRSQEIDAILTKAKEANILKEVLKTTYIAVKSVDYTSFTNKPPYMVIPFSYACSLADKTIDYILTKAKEANILKEVLTTANITVEREDIGQVSVLTPFEYQHLNVLTPFGHKCPPYTGCKITIKRKMENDKYEYDIVMPTSHIPSTSPISSNDHDDQKTPTSLDKLSEHKGKVIFGAIVFCIANTIAAALITPWLAITAAVAAIVAISVFVKEIHSEYKQQDADEKSVLKATGTVLSDMIPECIKPQKVGPCI
ncbi:hypothetical protein [Wolbachia endosymbiont (group B) of Limnophora tigrina]|uniref:hypothetical protein n=1 Tax=Wolbachia endosymbiont (group B) of Limnophora tigrina TaxID=3139317 RepID=UPI0035B505E3